MGEFSSAEMVALVLPADFPGLREEAERLARERFAALVAVAHGFVAPWETHRPGIHEIEVGAMVALLRDCSRRESRAWVREWLAARWGKSPPESGLAVFGRGWELTRGIWGVWLLPDGPYDLTPDGGNNIVCVPALATLDPNDSRPLPDGSRWVDARALVLVACQMAGVEAP